MDTSEKALLLNNGACQPMLKTSADCRTET
jgi:hypothetical protein